MPKKPVPHPAPYHHGDLRRALIEAALNLVTEEQDWTFSLREVARRAGVSHAAPHNHFPEKKDLLAAVAAAGFERLRDGMLSAAAGIQDAETAFAVVGRTYVHLGIANPALHRLMFGPALSDSSYNDRPTVARTAGAAARAVLEEIILRGARSGAFALSPESPRELALGVVCAWSAMHGLTMLIIDNLAGFDLPVEGMIDGAIRMVVAGLR